MSKRTGGPAFPVTETVVGLGKSQPNSEGMTLRDYFAAKAMQGIIACGYLRHEGDVAREAYKQADAMLNAREAK